MKTEKLKWVALLVSSLPIRLPSGIDLKLALEGYGIALEDCELQDIEAAVHRCIKGVPIAYKWCPAAPELRQLAKDAQARREHPHVEAITNGLPPDLIVSDKVRAKRVARVSTLLGPMSHEQWVAECIKWGTIKPYGAV